jgi:hypothetical protein
MRKITRNQRQEGGVGAQQIQVAGDLVLGVTEQRATEIASEQARIAIQEFTAEAAAEASSRMDKLDEEVVDELSARGLLTAFADPAFQILLRKTQLHAASTSEDADYELLSKLLSERAGKPTKPIHMMVSRAVEVVEYLDSEALTGMMFLWFVIAIGPRDGDPKAGLATIDGLASKLLAGGDLPQGLGWLQRLDLMGCINYRPVGSGIQMQMTKWEEYYLRQRPGYISEGIMPEDVEPIRVKLNRVIPNLSSMIVEHAFLPGRFRLNTLSAAQLVKDLETPLNVMRSIKDQIPEEALRQLPIQPMLAALGTGEELESVLLEAKVDAVNTEARTHMLEYVESHLPNLQKIRMWWDSLKGLEGITPIGTAIAFSNAKRFDPLIGLPPLSEMIGMP